VSETLLERLSDAVRRRKVTLKLDWRGDGWYMTELRTEDDWTIWPPYPTLTEAVTTYLAAREAP